MSALGRGWRSAVALVVGVLVIAGTLFGSDDWFSGMRTMPSGAIVQTSLDSPVPVKAIRAPSGDHPGSVSVICMSIDSHGGGFG